MAWRISNGRIDRLVVFKAMGDDHVPIGELTFEGSARVRQGRFVYAGSWLNAKKGVGVNYWVKAI